MILFFLALLQPSLSHALGPPSVQANQDGVKRYGDEDYAGAFRDFAKALGKDAYNPTFHFNLGDAFLKNGEIGKAITEYEAVEKNPKADTDLKFKSMFNAGNAALETKDIGKALSYYQKALQYRPDSIEVKTNIELALKDPQGGGGSSDNKDKQQQKPDDKQQQNGSGNDKDKKDQQDQKQPQQEPKEKPKPFQSQALNENDVRRILEELKRQEEQIRAKQNFDNKKTPEKQIEKDW